MRRRVSESPGFFERTGHAMDTYLTPPRRGATDRREERHSIVDGAGAVDSGAFTSSLRGASKATTEPIKNGESV